MKAESAILTGAQIPMTWFGLPPSLFVVSVAATAITIGVMVATGFMVLSLPMAVVVFVVLWITFFRRNRRDHHFAKLLIIAPRFWRRQQSRTLIAGKPGDPND